MARLLCLLSLVLLVGCPLTPFDGAQDDDDFVSDDDDDAGDDDTTDDDDSGDDDDSTADDDDSTADDDDSTADDDDSTGDDDDSTGDDDDSTTAPLAYIYAHSATTLYTVDPVTFVVTSVGNFNAGWLTPDITDIAIDALGTMYAVGFSDLYTVNPTTAAMTHLGTFNDGYGTVNAATCLPDGSLILGGFGDLYTSSTTTASRTLLGSVSGDWVFAGDTVGLPDGLLYNLMAEDDPSNPTSLLSVDPTNMAMQVLGPTGTGPMFGLAYHSQNALVYGFTEAGDIYTIDPVTGQATLEAQTSVSFWGATTNPARW